MNTIKAEVRNLVADCFVYSGGSYKPSNSSLDAKMDPPMPTVSAKYEQLLIDNNIAYNKLGNECEIYDKDCYKREALTLPVYVYHGLKSAYIYTGKSHTEQILTEESIKAAYGVKGQVDCLIQEANFEELTQKIKSLLGNNAITFISTSSPILPELEIYRFKLAENRYYISALYANEGIGRYFGHVIVDLKEAEKVSVLDMYVLEHLAGITIGKGGRNLMYLMDKINQIKPVQIDRINVHKIAS